MRILAPSGIIAFFFACSIATAQTEPADPVLVELGELKLYRSEYESELMKLPPDIRPGFASSPRRVLDLLNRLIVQKALAAQAREQKIAEMPEYAVRYRLELDRLFAQFRIAELEERAGREFDARRAAFETRARELYSVDRKKYEVAEQVSASHILFDTRKRSKEEALALATEARAKAAAGADFDALAQTISEDPSAKTNSGRLGFFVRTDMDPAFAEAAFSLKQPGDLSQPVLSQFGWHVIKLEQRRPAGVRSFDEVREQIVAELRRKYIDEKREALVSSIRADPALKLNQQAMEALLVRADPEVVKRLIEQTTASPPTGTAPASK